MSERARQRGAPSDETDESHPHQDSRQEHSSSLAQGLRAQALASLLPIASLMAGVWHITSLSLQTFIYTRATIIVSNGVTVKIEGVKALSIMLDTQKVITELGLLLGKWKEKNRTLRTVLRTKQTRSTVDSRAAAFKLNLEEWLSLPEKRMKDIPAKAWGCESH